MMMGNQNPLQLLGENGIEDEKEETFNIEHN